jgi:beta-glucosidase
MQIIIQKFICKVLRDSWGFEGFVVTDYGNIHNLINHHRVEESLTAASLSALKCGNDVMMGTSVFKEHAEEAVKEGLLDEKLIDDSCRKVLKAKMQLGLFDNWKVLFCF